MTGLANMQKRAFAANQQSVGVIDKWIAEIARGAGLDDRTAFAARLCIAELANNVIQHGRVTPDDQITVTIHPSRERLDIEFQDTATLGVLQDGLALAFRELGYRIHRDAKR